MNTSKQKKTAKSSKNSMQVIDIKELPENPYQIKIFNRDVRYLKTKDVKASLFQIIQDYCKGMVQSDEAKTLVYLFSGYLQLIRDIEFEDRLRDIENRFNNNERIK